ncbi:hypothetical protein DSL72_003907 [Monilinia vaccinii-corymbosi]|uniref:Transglycosylase SLT domain-containing protein n=1 Tax=Monilinia vaccinii-corymbosi TaxID=61207 RepID=A0A8A3NV85_9HELO|nr:hypothetical protein DSL72_003907 [Monilinia vaccinii-corymbosi]
MRSNFLTAALAMEMIACAAPSPLAGTTHEKHVKRAPAYHVFTGDGHHWPGKSAWASFDTMWANSQPVMAVSCTQFGQANNAPTEVECIRNAIIETGASSGVDPRFILAIVMQESGGCVRAPTTIGSYPNPGLMQDHNGVHSCNNGGAVQNPCSADTIAGMIHEGTRGTASGDGLQQLLEQVGETHTAHSAYIAARMYNSGSYARGTDLSAPEWGTSCYVSDVANRLLGWSAPVTPCNFHNPHH